jgi:hypothetical protein
LISESSRTWASIDRFAVERFDLSVPGHHGDGRLGIANDPEYLRQVTARAGEVVSVAAQCPAPGGPAVAPAEPGRTTAPVRGSWDALDRRTPAEATGRPGPCAGSDLLIGRAGRSAMAVEHTSRSHPRSPFPPAEALPPLRRGMPTQLRKTLTETRAARDGLVGC